MEEMERRVKRCLYEMQLDQGNDAFRPKHYMSILEGRDQVGKD